MSAAAVSEWVSKCGWGWGCRSLHAETSHHLFSFKLLGFSDAEGGDCGGEHLSRWVRYCYVYILNRTALRTV